MHHAMTATLFLVLAAFPSRASDYHYVSGYNGKEFVMDEIPGQIQVSFDAGVSAATARDALTGAGMEIVRTAQAGGAYALVRVTDDSALAGLQAAPSVASAMPLLVDQEGFVKTFAPAELTAQFHPTVSVARQHEVISDLGAGVVRRQRTPGYYTLSVPNDMTLFEAIRAFNEHSDVHFAELSAFGFDDALEVPDDPLFEDQWHLRNTGQSGGTAGADIEAVEGWDLFLGDENVVVSVVDTGIDWDHPDLAPRVVDIGDEDWDFESEAGKIPHDSGYHGTCCNGITGGATNNAIGISGVARGCRLMPLKVNLASGQNQNRADAINYAASRADDFTHIVLSMSWRMSSGDFAAVEAACQNAFDAGLLTCVASGNDDGAITYPALYPTTIAVGATSPCDERKNPNSCDGEWWGSNYGPMLNVAARE